MRSSFVHWVSAGPVNLGVRQQFNDLYAAWHFDRYRPHREHIIEQITTGHVVPESTFPSTPLCGEQDRAVFENWIRVGSRTDLGMRRG
jgi:hypothetical protein